MADSDLNKKQYQTAGNHLVSSEINDIRKFKRYKVSVSAEITNLIYENYAYTLYKPFRVRLIDISQSGVKIRTSYDALPIGCRFELRFKINGKIKHILTETIYESHLDNMRSEYGCHFYASEKLVQRIAL